MRLKKIKLFLPVFFWILFAYVVINVSYPETITQANFFQLIYFFTPLTIALLLSINLALKSFYKSAVITLGLVILLILKSLETLNFITSAITIAGVVLLIGSFKRQV